MAAGAAELPGRVFAVITDKHRPRGSDNRSEVCIRTLDCRVLTQEIIIKWQKKKHIYVTLKSISSGNLELDFLNNSLSLLHACASSGSRQ